MFSVAMLERVPDPNADPYHRPRPDEPPSVFVEGDTEHEKSFELEKIVDKQVSARGRVRYLVRWKGYGPEHDQWKTSGQMINAKELVEEYETKRAAANTLPASSDTIASSRNTASALPHTSSPHTDIDETHPPYTSTLQNTISTLPHTSTVAPSSMSPQPTQTSPTSRLLSLKTVPHDDRSSGASSNQPLEGLVPNAETQLQLYKPSPKPSKSTRSSALPALPTQLKKKRRGRPRKKPSS